MLLIFSTVNGLFVFKYSSDAGLNPIAMLISYLIFIPLCFYVYKKLYVRFFRNKVIVFYLLAALILLVSIILFMMIDPNRVTVDRWSAIYNWSKNLQMGLYPYAAQTHTGGYGSPFPVWQLFYFPFCMMGDVCWAQLFCVILLFAFLYKSRHIHLIRMNLFILHIISIFVCSKRIWLWKQIKKNGFVRDK